jgi:Asp-tRNA(Asn)/Glu-tRNA(Gln) amidotransferase A subunit family amidase
VRLSAEQVVQGCLAKIENEDDHLAAWSYIDAERALASARDVDAGLVTGSLAGVTVGIKGSIAVAGLPLDMGSPAYADRIAVRDAAVVARLRAAGAIILGTNRLHELAIGDAVESGPWRTSRHPWNDDFVPGGSSCGSAVAVAAGMCAVSVGGDTGGSIRNPAASCGVVGFKPTTGSVDGAGIGTLCWSLDSAGYFAADVEGVLAVAAVVTGLPERSQFSRPRIAVIDNSWDDDVDDGIRGILEDAVRALGRITRTSAVPSLPLGEAAAIWQARSVEIAMAHRVTFAATPELFGPSVRPLLSAESTVDRYAESFIAAAAFTTKIDEAFTETDVLLLPSNPTPALDWGAWTGSGQETSAVWDWYRFMWPFNVSGHPAVSVPWDLDPATGVPRAVQLVGRRGEDLTVLEAALLIEQVRPGLPVWQPRV